MVILAGCGDSGEMTGAGMPELAGEWEWREAVGGPLDATSVNLGRGAIVTFAPPDSYEILWEGQTTVGKYSSGTEGRSILTGRAGPQLTFSKRPEFLYDDTYIVEVSGDSLRLLTLMDDDFDHLLVRRRAAGDAR